MIWKEAHWLFLGIAAFPLIYYLIALYSSWRYFSSSMPQHGARGEFLRPVSILKPIRGIDPDAYENFASFCRQDYPDYEILFCVDGEHDPALPVIDRLCRDFPDRHIRILFGSGRKAPNDKVAKLSRLVTEARHELLVISDSDVRVRPDYLRTVVAPLADPAVGAVTCFYVPADETTLVHSLQSIGMVSDFYAGILVARQLDGVKFALGPTIATFRKRLADFGGYAALENRPADDLLVGRLIAEQGYEVKLLPYSILTVPDYQSIRDLFYKRLRWIVVMRHMRPWGHLGLIFTHGLFWSIAAVLVQPSLGAALVYLGGYSVLRSAMVWLIGIHGLEQKGLWKTMPLLPVWDALAFFIWLISFARDSIRWRDQEYFIRDGILVPVSPTATEDRLAEAFDAPTPKRRLSG
jgi:ceramide glucosyltransferase